MDTDELLGRFEAEYLAPNSITPGRRKEQLSWLRKLAEYIERPLQTIRPEEVREFIGLEMTAGLHPNTGRKHMGMFRSFLTWASAAGLIDQQATAQLRLVRNPRGSRSRSFPNPYKPEEIPILLRAVAERFPPMPTTGRRSRLLYYWQMRNHPMRHALWRHAKRLQLEAQIALALECGLRRLEIHSTTIAALDDVNEDLPVLTAKQGPGRDIKRFVPYAPHARWCVRQWLDFRWSLGVEHEYPWLSLEHDKPTRENQLEPQPLRKLGRSLERDIDPYWRWHRLRHTAATEWLRAGVPIEKVRIFMGHSSIEQTLAYLEILRGDVRHDFDKAHGNFARRLGLPQPPDDEEAA